MRGMAVCCAGALLVEIGMGLRGLSVLGKEGTGWFEGFRLAGAASASSS